MLLIFMNNAPRSLSPTPRALILALATIVCCGFAATPARAAFTPPASDHVDINFNYDWKFIKEDAAGAEAPAFDDSSWAPVSLPHSYNDDKFRTFISEQRDIY